MVFVHYVIEGSLPGENIRFDSIIFALIYIYAFRIIVGRYPVAYEVEDKLDEE